MSEQILLFSSDATDLYKGDIFRVTALPSEYTIQFRYEQQYVLEALWKQSDGLKNRDAVIFFLAGNRPGTDSAKRKLVPFAIRSCQIKEALIDDNTNQLILILALRGFVNCDLKLESSPDRLPPKAFVTELQLPTISSARWIDRVSAIQENFSNVLFYRIGAILKGKDAVSPSYSEDRRISFFELEEESDYALECSCYDPSGGGRSPLMIDFKSDELSLDNSFESGPRASRDTRRLPLTTRSLKTRSSPASFLFYSPSLGTNLSTGVGSAADPNEVRIFWLLKRRSSKPWLFALFTLFAALGLALSQLPLKADPSQWMPPCPLALKIFGLFLIAAAGGCLFNFFNKT